MHSLGSRFHHVLIFLLSLAAFWPAMHYEFVNWDDPGILVSHPLFARLSLENFLAIWNPATLWQDFAEIYYPMTDMSYLWDRWIWDWNPRGFHFTSLLFHALNSVLVMILFGAYFDRRTAFLAAAVWAFHPLAVETAVWISARKELLMTFFFLLSILFFQREKGKWGFLCGVFSVLSKVTGFMIGPLLLIWGVLEKNRRRILWGLALMAIGSLSLVYQSYVFVHRDWSITQTAATSPLSLWPAGFQTIFHNVSVFFWPVDLSARYVQDPSLGFASTKVLWGLALSITYVLALLILLRKRHPAARGLLLAFFAYAPYLTLSQNIWMADRYLYLASVGIVFSLVTFLGHFNRIHSFLRPAVLAFLAIVLVFVARLELPKWQNSLTLWAATSQTSPSLYYVWSNLGDAQQANGLLGEAKKSYAKAIERHPHWAKGHLRLASFSAREEDRPATLRHLQAYREHASKDERIRQRAEEAKTLARIGEKEKAQKLFSRYLRERPNDAKAFADYGTFLAIEGREKKAWENWERAVELRPDQSEARINRARFWFRQRDCSKVKKELSFSARFNRQQKHQAAWLHQNCK